MAQSHSAVTLTGAIVDFRYTRALFSGRAGECNFLPLFLKDGLAGRDRAIPIHDVDADTICLSAVGGVLRKVRSRAGKVD
jgi:hypothetical protein